MRKLITFLLAAIGCLAVIASALALLVAAFPELNLSRRVRLAVADNLHRWVDTSPTPAVQTASKTLYQCSMHPQIISDKPGLCPICQMRLEPVQMESGATPHGANRIPIFYRHPMRPDVTSPQPAKDEMGMDYVPVYADEVADGSSTVPAHAPFTLSSERQQLIGVRRAKVERRDLTTEIRAVGKVAYDPALYQAIVEYQQARAGKQRLANSQSSEAQAGADAILRSAALRLRQLGIGEQQLREAAETTRAPLNLLLPGKTAWIYAQVYEYEVDLLRPGQSATVIAPSLAQRTYSGRVASIDPILTAATRTARVRIEVTTPAADLKPEMFVHVRIAVPSGQRLAVPAEAILNTGEHQIAFVVTEPGRFEPRSVELGRMAHDYYEVLAGLSEGEEVVTSANFLIDSESRFRSAVAAFSKNAGAAH